MSNAKSICAVGYILAVLFGCLLILAVASLVEARTKLREARQAEETVGFVFAGIGEAWQVCQSMHGNSCGGIRRVPDGWVLEPRTEF